MRTLLLLFCASLAGATNYTTTGSGNWSDHTKWTPDPGSGNYPCQVASNKDQVSIGHAMTIDGLTLTCGRSAPGTPYRASEQITGWNASGGGATGGSLPGGNYYIAWTCVDSNGAESGLSTEFVTNTVSAGNQPLITWPARPAQCVSRNLYAGYSFGAETLYATGITATTYTMSSGSWNNGTQTQAAAPAIPANRGAAVLVTAGGLTLAANSSLVLRGDLLWRNNALTMTMQQGSSIQFDGSQAVTPSAASYVWTWGATSGADTNQLTTTCTALAPCSISSNSGGAAAWMTNLISFSYSGGFNPNFYNGNPACSISYLSVDNMGDSTPGDDALICGRGTGTPTNTISRVIFGQNGPTGMLNLTGAAGESFVVDHVSFKNSVGQHTSGSTFSGPVWFGTAASPTGTLTMSYVYADKTLLMVKPGWTFDHVQFVGNLYYNTTNTNITNSFLVSTGAAATTYSGNIDTAYVLTDDGWATSTPLSTGTATGATSTTLTDSSKSWTVNAYACCNGTSVITTGGTGAGQARMIVSNTATTLTVSQPWTVTPDATTTYQIKTGLQHLHVISMNGNTATLNNVIFDYLGTMGGGHCTNLSVNTGQTVTVKGLISTVTPGMEGTCDHGIGTSGTGHYIAEHSTIPSDGLLLGDYSTTTGGLSSFKSNLIWKLPQWGSTAGVFVWNSNQASCTGTPQDQLAVGAGDYNYGWNIGMSPCPGQSGYGYSLNLSTPAGTHDVRETGTDPVNSGPRFVDPYRNFLAWAKANGSTGTIPQIIADAYAKMKTVNDFTGATTTYTIDSLIAWVRAGFQPRNPTLNYTYPGDAFTVQNVGAVTGNFVGLPAAFYSQPIVW